MAVAAAGGGTVGLDWVTTEGEGAIFVDIRGGGMYSTTLGANWVPIGPLWVPPALFVEFEFGNIEEPLATFTVKPFLGALQLSWCF